jgi:nitroimidazol reductase NimA-like FMN-containing flavoprotein (pyridoxamine 5'-phosphate oxidase superfamily)
MLQGSNRPYGRDVWPQRRLARHGKTERTRQAADGGGEHVTTGNRPTGSREVHGAVPGRDSPAPGPAARARVLRTLSPAECFDLLEAGGVGRVGFTSAGEIMMLPVTFAVTGKTIVFRTAPDTLLARYANAPVSFEVDHLDHALHEGWSVLVHGHAHQVTDERAVQRLEDGMRLEPWAPGARDVYVRIVPTQITGRRIQSD